MTQTNDEINKHNNEYILWFTVNHEMTQEYHGQNYFIFKFSQLALCMCVCV